MKQVSLLLLLTCFSLQNAHAQGLRGLVEKAKNKAKQAAGVGDTNASTTRNVQTAHSRASQPWYMYCVARHNSAAHYSEVFPLAYDPHAFLGATAAWNSFAKEQYGAEGSCEQLPTEQQAADRKAITERSQADHNRDLPDRYRMTISEVDWTPESTPSAGASSASSISSSASQSQASASGTAVPAGALVYTYCYMHRKSSPLTAYVSAVFPIHKQDRQTIYNTYVLAFRQFVAAQYHVASGRRYAGQSGCDDGYSTEAQAVTRRQEDMTFLKTNANSEVVIETGWTGGDRAGTSAPN